MTTRLAPFVDADGLASELDGVVVCHVGTTMAGTDPDDEFLRAHVPGARYVSLDDDLADPSGPVVGRHPLPTPPRFADVLGRLGIADDARVVGYDTQGGGFAARLVWMLRTIGHEAALLTGAWPGPFEAGAVEVEPTTHRVVAWPPEAVADGDDVAAQVATGGTVIDSRAPERFRGEVEPIDAVAGHIPGAINIAFTDDDPDRFDRLDPVDPAIVYCGSGVTACHNALAIEAAGYPRPKVYVGSWSGWSTDPDRPTDPRR